jgi:hypothetical protein
MIVDPGGGGAGMAKSVLDAGDIGTVLEDNGGTAGRAHSGSASA